MTDTTSVGAPRRRSASPDEYQSSGVPRDQIPPHVPPRGMSAKSKTLLIIGIIGLVVLIIIVSFLSSISQLGSGLEAFASKSELKEQVIVAAQGGAKDKLAVISLAAPIFGSGSPQAGEGMLYEVSRRLRRASMDASVKGVLIQLDSPGGGISASDIIHSEVKNLRAKGKPVVVTVGSLAASGGYYVACASDWIVASPTALVGSIGVIIQHLEASALLGKLGVKADPIKSADLKDAGSLFRPMKESERAYFQSLVDTYYQHFVGIVAEGRSLEAEAVKALADGRIFIAHEALNAKLIDQIGYYDDAVDKLRQMANAENAALVRYEKSFDIGSLFDDFTRLQSRQSMPMEELFSRAAVPQVHALWVGPAPAQ